MNHFDLQGCLEKEIGDQLLIAEDYLQGGLSGKHISQLVKRMLAWLDDNQFQTGDFCAFQDFHSIDSFIFLLACFTRGIIAVPLNPRFQGAHLQPYLSQLPTHRFIRVPDSKTLTEMVTDAAYTIATERAALIIFTSGSSGYPKGVAHSWSSLENSALGTHRFYRLGDGWTWLLSLGLFHVGGLLIAMRALLGRGCMQVLAPGQSLADGIRRWRPRWLSLVPTQLQDLIKDPELVRQLQFCEGIVLGGAAASHDLLMEAFDLKLPLSLSYGSSETAAQITACPVGFRPKDLSRPSSGFVLPGREVLIEEGSQRIMCRGPSLFLGYWEKGLFHPHPQGAWFPTSDRGIWTDEGLRVLGRMDDVFMCGGEGLSRSEIQAVVDEVVPNWKTAVCCLSDIRLGGIPVLLIEAADRPELESMLAKLNANLPALKRPRQIYWTSQSLFNRMEKRPIGLLEAILNQSPNDLNLHLLWQAKN